MKILICTFSFPDDKTDTFDGKFVLYEAMAYAENGADVLVLTPHFAGSEKYTIINKSLKVKRFIYFLPEKFQTLKKPNVPLYNICSILDIIQLPFFCISFVYNILKYSRKVDLIHAQWTLSAFFALPAKWLYGKKIVMTARGSDIRLLPISINKYIHRKVDSVIDCFGPIKWNINYKALFPANYLKLPLIVDDKASSDVPEDMDSVLKILSDDVLIILFVGRFDPLKINIYKLPLFDLIESAKNLKQKNRKFHVFFIGDGDIEIKKNMHQLIGKNKLKSYITLLGPKNNVMDYIVRCDIGIGGIAMNSVSQEFTVAAKPQILIDIPDNKNSLWKKNHNSLFVKPDNIEELSNKLEWAINNKKCLSAIGKNAYQDLRDYIANIEEGGYIYLDKYKLLLEKV